MRKIVTLLLVFVILSTVSFAVLATGDDTELIPSYKVGDVNLDGKVNIRDASVLQMYLVREIDFTSQQMKLADIDNNGSVKIRDVTYLQMYLNGEYVIVQPTQATQPTTKDVITLPFVPAN